MGLVRCDICATCLAKITDKSCELLKGDSRARIFITVTSYERHVVSYHQQPDCLFDSLFGLAATITSKVHITGPFHLCSPWLCHGTLSAFYCPFVRRMYRWVPFAISLNKLVNKQSSGWWFEIPWRSLTLRRSRTRFGVSFVSSIAKRHGR